MLNIKRNGNSRFRTPHFFFFIKLLKNGQSVLDYRTRRAVSNDTKIKKIGLDLTEIQDP